MNFDLSLYMLFNKKVGIYEKIHNIQFKKIPLV